MQPEQSKAFLSAPSSTINCRISPAQLGSSMDRQVNFAILGGIGCALPKETVYGLGVTLVNSWHNVTYVFHVRCRPYTSHVVYFFFTGDSVAL